MTESQFKTRAVALLRRYLPGAWVYHPSDKWVSGIPDLLILYRGVFAAVELKVGKNKASRLQEYTLAKIRTAGGLTWICYGNAGLTEIKAVIQAIIEAAIKSAKENV